jgi:hypothetical protein
LANFGLLSLYLIHHHAVNERSSNWLGEVCDDIEPWTRSLSGRGFSNALGWLSSRLVFARCSAFFTPFEALAVALKVKFILPTCIVTLRAFDGVYR